MTALPPQLGRAEFIPARFWHMHSAHAPYDRIIATCSVNDAVPNAWLEQIRTGGRLIVPWGNDMCSHDEAAFAIGAVVGNCYLDLRLNHHGPWQHHAELDDYHTGSWAEVDVNMDADTPCRVRQLGPRCLWDEVTTAYRWWHGHGQPGPQRFGFDASDGIQRIWLDRPDHHLRTLTG